MSRSLEGCKNVEEAHLLVAGVTPAALRRLLHHESVLCAALLVLLRVAVGVASTACVDQPTSPHSLLNASKASVPGLPHVRHIHTSSGSSAGAACCFFFLGTADFFFLPPFAGALLSRQSVHQRALPALRISWMRSGLACAEVRDGCQSGHQCAQC